jgi:hypothetical protein
METYSFLRFTEHELDYFMLLFDKCREGGKVEGKKAVDFLKLSGVSPVSADKVTWVRLF